MLVTALLASVAVATTPGGLRLDSGLGGLEVRMREALALRGDGPAGTYQGLLDMQVPMTVAKLPVVLEAEGVGVYHWDRGEQVAAPGQLRLAGRLSSEVLGSDGAVAAANSWGLELALPTSFALPEGGHALVAVESQPALELIYVIEMSLRLGGGGWLHLRGGAGGIRRLSPADQAWWPPAPMVDVGAAWVAPLAGSALAMGHEFELITDAVPFSTRHFLRLELGAQACLDAGVHLPWVQITSRRSELGMVGQLTWRPPRAESRTP